MKDLRRHSESVGAQLDGECLKIIQLITEETKAYPLNYVYNIDEIEKA